jgi:predicted nucleotidyltransferase
VPEITPDFFRILETLTQHEVKFIVVGGVCAVLHGAPVTTFDLDLVHSRVPENLDRLMSALVTLDAYYRGQAGRQITPDLSHLSSPGHQLLMTRLGPLDLLGTIGKGYDYDDLLGDTVNLQVNDMQLRILTLETLIKLKEETGGEKDKAVLPILRRTLEEKLRSQNPSSHRT